MIPRAEGIERETVLIYARGDDANGVNFADRHRVTRRSILRS